MRHIKEVAGFANIFFSDVPARLGAIYSNPYILAWFLSFQVGRKLKGKTIALHAVTGRKVLEWIEAKVRSSHRVLQTMCPATSAAGLPFDGPECCAGQQPM